MLFSLIAIVVAALALLALVISQLKTREEMEALRNELARVSAQASDASLQIKMTHDTAKKPETPAVEKAAPPAPVRAEAPAPAPAASPTIKVKGEAEIPPEILMVISAAVAAFLRKTGRVRSPRPAQGISPWAQQGRVIVQASHNLAAKR